MKKYSIYILKYMIYMAVAIISLVLSHSCSKPLYPDYIYNSNNYSDTGSKRLPIDESRHTFIIFSLAHNNLAESLRDDIEEIKQGYIPGNKRTENVLLVFSHNSSDKYYWKDPSEPVLTRIYRNLSGEIVTDTLKTWSNSTISADPKLIKEVLEFSKKSFPSASYGALFSSHGTGYLPVGFFLDPDKYFYPEKGVDGRQKRMAAKPEPLPYKEPDYPEDWIMVKSFGQDVQDGNLSYEMDIIHLADAIPFKLSYILFDSCLMGGIEVAYQFKDKCDKIGFSQTEVLSNGFVYTSMGEHLLRGEPKPELICKDYFNSYDIQSGVYRSATISCIDCNKLDNLTSVCRDLFATYRNTLKVMPAHKIQKYFRYNQHWYYDLEDIVNNLGADANKLQEFRNALEECTIYKGATPAFMDGYGGFKIRTFSGLSMYLPSDGHRELNKYYKDLEWNKATNLVL